MTPRLQAVSQDCCAGEHVICQRVRQTSLSNPPPPRPPPCTFASLVTHNTCSHHAYDNPTGRLLTAYGCVHTIPDSFCAGMKTIPDRASVHTQER